MTARPVVAVWAAAALFVLAFLALVMGALVAIEQQREVNQRLCLQTVDNRDAQRRTWLAAQTFILRGQPDQEGRDRTREFFQAVLITIPQLQCVDRKPVEVVDG